MEELAKGKHVFQAALQWSAVLLNRTKTRIKPLFELNRTAATAPAGNIRDCTPLTFRVVRVKNKGFSSMYPINLRVTRI